MSVGSTRLVAQAGPVIDIAAYLAGDLAETKVPVLISNVGWIYGTGANCANIVYADKVTLTDGGNDTINLKDSGTLLDVFGRVLTLTALKLLYIKNNSTDATLLVGGGVSLDLILFADTSDIVKIKPGGSMIWVDPSAAGIDVTTNKNLYIAHDGTGSSTMVVDIVAMGLD